jgi:hypothetical protein
MILHWKNGERQWSELEGLKIRKLCQAWWYMPVTPVLESQSETEGL